MVNREPIKIVVHHEDYYVYEQGKRRLVKGYTETVDMPKNMSELMKHKDENR